MEKIILQDGTEREVPTAEELAELTKKSESADELTTQNEEYKTKIDAFDTDPANKNWKELRDVNSKLRTALKDSGKDVSDDGTITEKSEALTAEQIREEASSATKKTILDQQKNDLFSKITDEEQKKVVEHYFDKLSSGEELDFNGVSKVFTEAQRLATPQDGANDTTVGAYGAPPRTHIGEEKRTDFAETDAGKAIADDMYGDDSFTKAK